MSCLTRSKALEASTKQPNTADAWWMYLEITFLRRPVHNDVEKFRLKPNCRWFVKKKSEYSYRKIRILCVVKFMPIAPQTHSMNLNYMLWFICLIVSMFVMYTSYYANSVYVISQKFTYLHRFVCVNFRSYGIQRSRHMTMTNNSCRTISQYIGQCRSSMKSWSQDKQLRAICLRMFTLMNSLNNAIRRKLNTMKVCWWQGVQQRGSKPITTKVSCEFCKVCNFWAHKFAMFSLPEAPSTVEIKPRVLEWWLTCFFSDQKSREQVKTSTIFWCGRKSCLQLIRHNSNLNLHLDLHLIWRRTQAEGEPASSQTLCQKFTLYLNSLTWSFQPAKWDCQLWEWGIHNLAIT